MATIIIALDVPTPAKALALVDRLGDVVDYYKVGAPLYTRGGPTVVRELRARGKRVFLDLKYYDIPNTVAAAIEAAAELEVDMLTLHISGGTAMMRAAREAAGPAGNGGPRLLGVTLLTSFAASELEDMWDKELRSMREEVSRMASLAFDAGLDGVVASPLEAEQLKRRHGAGFIVVTPGIRPAGSMAGDQSRIATPAEAVRAGSDFLVIGRPVLHAKDPLKAVRGIREEIASPPESAE